MSRRAKRHARGRYVAEGVVSLEDAYEKAVDTDAFRVALEAKGTKLVLED